MTSDVRRKWFVQLASLTYPASPGQAAEAFKPYMPMLEHLPDGAFTVRSLEHVVTSPRKMAIPSYDEVAKPLSVWWRENRPFQTALPAPTIPDRVIPTEDVMAVVAALTREAKGILAQSLADKTTASRPHTPRYVSDKVLMATLEKQVADTADAPAGTTGAAHCALAKLRLDGLRRKHGEMADAG